MGLEGTMMSRNGCDVEKDVYDRGVGMGGRWARGGGILMQEGGRGERYDSENVM